MTIASGVSSVNGIALRLTIGRDPDDAGVWAMATLISPTEAITPFHVVRSLDAESQVRARLGSLPDASAVVVASDQSVDLALLKLSPPLPFPVDIGVIDSRARSGESWSSFIMIPSLPDGRLLSGSINGHHVQNGVDYLQLSSEMNLSDPLGSSGAPVVVRGSVAGVLASSDEHGREWYAAPVTREIVARLRQQPPQQQPRRQEVVREPGTALDPAYVFGHMSPSSSEALRIADSLRRARNQDRVHMEHLVMGLFLKEHGPTERLFSIKGLRSEADLRRLLNKNTDFQLPEPGTYTIRKPTAMPPLSRHVSEAFVHAQRVASDRESPLIRSRHLLYGVLSVDDCEVARALLQRGITRDLIELDEGKAPVTPITAIVGADSDAPSGIDRLGLKTEIETLSALVASRTTKTPMSIGLFGNWGSGKSFFMQKMDEKVREYRDTARGETNSPYCSNIVQLWFNAWHYIDRSLWASLGAEIFEGLAHGLTEVEAKKEGRSKLEDARTELLIKRKAAESARADAEAAASSSTAALNASKTRIAQIESRSDRDIEDALGTKAIITDIWKVTRSQPEVKEKLDEAAQKLGWPKLTEQSEVAANHVKEILAIEGFWQSVVAMVRNRGSARWWIAAAAVAGLSLLLSEWILPVSLKLEATVSRALSLITGFTLIAAPIVQIAARVSSVVKDARSTMAERIATARQAELEAATKLREDAEAKANDTHRELETREKAVKEIDAQLDALKPTRQFIDFIRSRNQSNDYTKHFGVIARARRDFEELTRLMELVRDTPAAKGEQQAFPPIERIVLYIDDLDRCPENKVFEVLQAVHLLLAFPLFVVVVGVDPRWLFHSLRANLEAFSGQSDEHVADGEQRLRWQSTPLNYLEKIFQIPFTLRPMNNTGYEQLIDDLTKAQATDEAGDRRETNQDRPVTDMKGTGDSQTPDPATGPTGHVGPDKKAPAQSDPQEKKGKTVTERVKQEANQTHERLNLEPWEAAYMKQLYALIPSPRATKRYVNVYRLLRGITTGADRKALIGNENDGGYCSVLLLLAMVTGYPVEAAEIMRQLLERLAQRDHPKKWWDLIDAIRKSREPQTGRPKPPKPARRTATAPATLDSDMHENDDEYRWEELFEKLDVVRESLPDLQSSTVGEWAPKVARYSFASGRLLVVESA